MYLDGLYYFDLDSCEQDRNNDLISKFNGVYVSFGGMVLPIQGYIPRQLRHEIKSRTWLTRDSVGKKSATNSVKKNKDGSVETTTEVSYTRTDGTRVREIKVVVTEAPDPILASLVSANYSSFGSLLNLFNAARVSKRGTYTTSVSSTYPKQFPRSITRTTITTPPASVIENVVQATTVFDPIEANSSGSPRSRTRVSRSKRKVQQSSPLYFQKPVELISIDGTKYIQYLGEDNRDIPYYNDEMSSQHAYSPINSKFDLTPGISDDMEEEITDDPSTNTRTTRWTTVSVDADGNRTETANERLEPLIDPAQVLEQLRNENGTQETETIRQGLVEISTAITYNQYGEKLREVVTTTTRQPQETVTKSTDVSSDGTSSTRRTVTSVDANGRDIVKETEVTNKDQTTTTVDRSDTIDYDNNVRTITLSRTTVDITGDTYRDEKTFRIALADEVNTSETVTEEKDDLIVNAVVYGHLINEFEFFGELIEDSLHRKITDKFFQHQTAWAMYDLLDQQLDLSDRLSPELKKDLYVDQYRVFTGNSGDSVRGGPVLDRIALDVMLDSYPHGCVIAPGGFKVEYIPGTDRMYKWSLTVRVYSTVIKDDFSRALSSLELTSNSSWASLPTDLIKLPGAYT